MYPAFDAFETILFVQGHTTNSGTHIKDAIDLKRTMVIVIFCMIPCILFGMWNIGYQYYNALGETVSLLDNFFLESHSKLSHLL